MQRLLRKTDWGKVEIHLDLLLLNARKNEAQTRRVKNEY